MYRPNPRFDTIRSARTNMATVRLGGVSYDESGDRNKTSFVVGDRRVHSDEDVKEGRGWALGGKGEIAVVRLSQDKFNFKHVV